MSFFLNWYPFWQHDTQFHLFYSDIQIGDETRLASQIMAQKYNFTYNFNTTLCLMDMSFKTISKQNHERWWNMVPCKCKLVEKNQLKEYD